MTTSPTTAPAVPSTPVQRTSRARRAATVAGAAAAGIAVWIVSVPLLGVELTATSGGSQLTVGPGAVVFAGLLAGGAGWGLLAVLERYTARPRALWTIVAVAVLVLSLIGPLAQATTVAAGATLAAMHIAVGTTIVVSLAGTARRGDDGR